MERRYFYRNLLFAICFLLHLQGISQSPDSISTVADSTPGVSEFVKQLQKVGREETQRSIKKYQSGINSVRQQKLLDELRLTIQKVKILLAKGLDTIYIDEELNKNASHLNTIRDGIFENKGSIQTQRNLAVSSAILTELNSRINILRKDVAYYGGTLMGYRNYIDSIYTDSVLYTFPNDSVAVAKYLGKIREVVKEIGAADSALEKEVLALPDLLNRVDDMAYQISAAQETIENSREDLTASTFSRELPNISGRLGFTRPLNEIIHFSYAKERLALKFYIKNNYGRIFILLILYILCAVFLVTIKNRTIQENVNERSADEELLLKFPNLSAAIIVISIFQFLFLEPPFIFSFSLCLAAVGCLTVIFREVISAYWFRFWVAILILFLIAGANNMVLQASRVERWFMLGVSLAGAAYGLYIMLGGKQKELKERKILYFIGFMIVFEIAAALYNIYGRYNFSKTLFVSGFTGMIIAILFLWTVRLLNAGLGVTSRVFKHPERKLFYINFEKLGNRVPLIFYIFLILGWIILVGKQFYAFNLVSRPFNEMLTTERTIGSYTFTVNGLFVFLIILSVSVLLSKIISFFASEPEANFDNPADRNKAGMGSWLLLVQILIISLGLFLAFAASGIPLDKITIILGALSVGIGLGLQGLVNNLVSGLIIAFEKPVNVGDVIELGGKTGTMKSIGFRSSVVSMSDGHSIIIPNGDLLSQQLVNWSGGKGHKKISLFFGVAYGTDIEKTITLIKDILNSEKGIIQRPPSVIVPLAFGAGAIELEVSFVINNFRDASVIRGRVIAAIDKRFKQEGIEIPIPQQDINIRSIINSKDAEKS